MQVAEQPRTNGVPNPPEAQVPDDIFQQTEPLAPVKTAPVVAQPLAPEPISVRIAAAQNPQQPIPPAPAAVEITHTIGKPLILQLDMSGDVRECPWEIEPPIDDVIYEEGGKRVICGVDKPGVYLFRVIAIGKDAGWAKHSMKVTFQDRQEVLDKFAAAKRIIAKDKQQPMVAKSEQGVNGRSSDETIANAIRRWTAEVHSASKTDDKRQVAEALREAADGGKSDMLAAAKAHTAELLGDAYADWETWWEHIDRLFADFEREGRLRAVGNRAGALQHVAEVLERK